MAGESNGSCRTMQIPAEVTARNTCWLMDNPTDKHPLIGCLSLLSFQYLFQFIGGGLLHSRENVAIRVERQHNRRMPQSFAYNLRILTGCEKKRGAGVPQIIGANVLQLRPIEYRLEVAALQISNRKRTTNTRRKHQVVILPGRSKL
jgi:hypothetical protein